MTDDESSPEIDGLGADHPDTEQDASVRPPEDTPESSEGQGLPEENPQENSANAADGDDFEPEPRPTDLPGWIARKERLVGELLAEKEKLKLAFVDQEIAFEYFSSWRQEANKAFALAVRIRRRLAEEGVETSAEDPSCGQAESEKTAS